MLWVRRCSLYDEQARVRYQVVGWRSAPQCINKAECIEVSVDEWAGAFKLGVHVVNIRMVEEKEIVISPVNDGIPRSRFQSEDVIKEGGFAYRSC